MPSGCIVCCPLLVDDEEQLLNTLLVSNYVIELDMDSNLLTPRVVNVITAQNIQRMGATTLEQVLATAPGIHVTTARNN